METNEFQGNFSIRVTLRDPHNPMTSSQLGLSYNILTIRVTLWDPHKPVVVTMYITLDQSAKLLI